MDTVPILHVSFIPVSTPDDEDVFPTILPMLGCTAPVDGSTPPPPADVTPGAFPEEVEEPVGPRYLYLHGHVSHRLMKQSGGDGAKGTPVCIAASELNGLVLALTPFHHSCNYRSAVIHGYASLITDEDERMRAMHMITDNTLANRWDNSRSPPTKAELTSTGMLRVEIASASAKVRVGGPGDDRHDLKNESVINNTWTGVVPSYIQYGEPVSSEYNKVQKVPRYMQNWIKAENDRMKKYSEKVAFPITE